MSKPGGRQGLALHGMFLRLPRELWPTPGASSPDLLCAANAWLFLPWLSRSVHFGRLTEHPPSANATLHLHLRWRKEGNGPDLGATLPWHSYWQHSQEQPPLWWPFLETRCCGEHTLSACYVVRGSQ